MAHVQVHPMQFRRNSDNMKNNFQRRGRRSHLNQKQSLQDIDGNIVMGGMETPDPSPAANRPSKPFNRQGPVFSQRQNFSQERKSQRRNRNRQGQNGQIVKPDMSPMNVHALSHAHPQMPAQRNNRLFLNHAKANSIARNHRHAAVQITSPPSPIKYVHMNGVLTPVDNCGDVVMGEAPSL